MSPELENALSELIHKTTDGLEMSSEQLPIVIQQFLGWHLLTSSICLGLGYFVLLIGIAFFVFARRARRLRKSPELCILFLFVTTAGLFVAVENSIEIVKIVYFEHYYVAQHAAEIITR